MDERARKEIVHRFFSGTAATYNRIVNLTTVGFDNRWKNRILEKIPAGSSKIVDQACGTGILTLKIARRFPQARIVGVDATEEYLRVAEKKVRDAGLRNIDLILGRAEDVLPAGSWDCVVSSYLAKYADLDRLVRNLGKMLRPGGVAVIQDFAYPTNAIFARLWAGWFVLLQTLGARRYPAWKPAFDGLPALIRKTDWMDRTQERLKQEGFTDVVVEPLTFGSAAIVSGINRSSEAAGQFRRPKGSYPRRP